jgi:hypothetical protein
MDLVANILNRRVTPHNQSLTKVGLNALSFRVHAHQPEFLPDAVDDVCHGEIELATHYCCVWFAGELVEEFDAYAVDFVVDVEAGVLLVLRVFFSLE